MEYRMQYVKIIFLCPVWSPIVSKANAQKKTLVLFGRGGGLFCGPKPLTEKLLMICTKLTRDDGDTTTLITDISVSL